MQLNNAIIIVGLIGISPSLSFAKTTLINKTDEILMVQVHYGNTSSKPMPCLFKDLTIDKNQEVVIDSTITTCLVQIVSITVITGPAIQQSLVVNVPLDTNDHIIEVAIQSSDKTLQAVLK